MNLFELFVKIGVKDEATDKIKDVEKTADKASKGGLANFVNKLGSGLKTAAKIGTTALGVAATGITALTTMAVNNYAEYEQLVGGVDTLFKDASEKVKGYANEAYRTSGMSANYYMENVTAFSASLISSLDNDTEAAAEYANRAMVSMSDNANKMGTNIDSIVQTYQSLSRGNFAMLDNLKLGYGGTKAELERLIADASTYTDIQKEMGITVDASSMSFDNIVNAIAVVQGKLGIAGATALEAGTTIEGSVNSMKSAWQNLITGIADDNADFGKLVDNFVTTIAGDGTENNLGVFGNLLPRIEVALEGAVKLIEGLFPKIIDALPDLIETLVPSLIDGAVNIIMALVEGLQENADMLAEVAVDAVFTLVEGLLSMLPKIIALGLDLIIALANGITKAIQDDGFIQTIIDVVTQIVETLTDPETLNALIYSALDLILALVEGLLSEESITALVDAVFMIIDAIVSFYTDPKNIMKLVQVGVDLVVAIAKGLIRAIWKIGESAYELADELWDSLQDTDWSQLGRNIMNSVWNGLSEIWNSIVDWFSGESGWFSGWFNDTTDTGGWSGSGGANRNFIDGSHAGGLARVPYDGYIAELHEGERVLTASEARRYNNNGYNGGTSTVNVTVGIDDSANAMGLARALLPFLKIAEKEVYA